MAILIQISLVALLMILQPFAISLAFLFLSVKATSLLYALAFISNCTMNPFCYIAFNSTLKKHLGLEKAEIKSHYANKLQRRSTAWADMTEA